MNDRRHNDSEVLVILGRLESKVDAIHETAGKLEHRLYGNGQPGDIDSLDTRITDLEEHRSKAIGWIAGAVAALTAIGAALEFGFHFVFGKKG